jgi:hypothetical protein
VTSVKKQPHPENLENLRKIQQCEERLQRLKDRLNSTDIQTQKRTRSVATDPEIDERQGPESSTINLIRQH